MVFNSKIYLNVIDMVVVTVPTTSNYPIAKEATLLYKHVFVEKPFMNTVVAKQLLKKEPETLEQSINQSCSGTVAL